MNWNLNNTMTLWKIVAVFFTLAMLIIACLTEEDDP